MSTSGESRPQKRMRLGTKSCAECRRRKVKCVFAPGNRTCQECLLHQAECTAQKPQITKSTQEDMQQKLEGLEAVVKRMCKAINLDANSSLADFEASAAEAMNFVRPDPTPEPTTDDGLSHRAGSSGGSVSEGPEALSDEGDNLDFENAPLLTLFRDALLVGKADEKCDVPRLASIKGRAKPHIDTLRYLMPDLRTLKIILTTTQPYWSMWKAFPAHLTDTSQISMPQGLENAISFYLESMKSDDSLIVIRAALCMALCLQQLPSGVSDTLVMAKTSKHLFDSIMDLTETLTGLVLGVSCPTDTLECLAIRSRIFIDAGKPRSAWLNCRRAIDYGVLAGLHRSDDLKTRILWQYTWQHERQISCLLGVPYAITDTQLGIDDSEIKGSFDEQTRAHLAAIAGKVNDHNQNHRGSNYTAALRIEAEIQQFVENMPPGFWDMGEYKEMPLDALYFRTGLRMFHLTIRSILHLPYMLMSSQDARYQTSAEVVLEASRNAITQYEAVREHPDGRHMTCDLLDFFVFLAAVNIVVYTISNKGPRDQLQEAADWNRVHSVINYQQEVSKVIQCDVASQAVQLLQYLSKAYHGMFAEPDYFAVIPYFGKVRVANVKRGFDPGTTPSGIGVSLCSNSASSLYSNTIDFGFDPLIQLPSIDIFSDQELGIDWTSLGDMDCSYEWTQSFATESMCSGDNGAPLQV